MDRVDAHVEAMLKNLNALVRGSQFGNSPTPTGGTDDPLLEVVASQLVSNCYDLHGVVSQLERAKEVEDFSKYRESCEGRKRLAGEVKSRADGELHALRRELKALLADLEEAYKK